MKCLNCEKREGQLISPYGWMNCKSCMNLQRGLKIGETIEISTSVIKEARKEYHDDILQRQRGSTPSLEYIKKYGTKGFSKDEIKQARNVWTENQPYVDKFERAK